MNKCWNCGVEIADPSHICPLCKCITEGEAAGAEQTFPYLHAEQGIKKMQRALNIYTFYAIVAELILCVVDFKVRGEPWWVIMIGAFLVYGFVTLKFSIQKHIGYRYKVLLQTLLGVSVLILIDVLFGFRGWSIHYVLPSAFLLIDATIIVLMLVNNRNWQSYIPMQLLVIALSVIPFVLRLFGISGDTLVSLIALTASILLFAGTLIVGGKRARDELYRRFHA